VGLGGQLGSGLQWVSWIDVRDALGIVQWGLESDIAGPVNVCAPAPLRQADLATAIGRTLHRPSWLAVPAWLIRFVLGPQATLVLGSRRVWPERALAGHYRFEVTRFEESLQAALR
jgi:NAD dependent epimerase/dehydratase family enzyme